MNKFLALLTIGFVVLIMNSGFTNSVAMVQVTPTLSLFTLTPTPTNTKISITLQPLPTNTNTPEKGCTDMVNGVCQLYLPNIYHQ
jgi:hypothetical protein